MQILLIVLQRLPGTNVEILTGGEMVPSFAEGVSRFTEQELFDWQMEFL